MNLQKPNHKIAVIGGGIGGISTAIGLLSEGYVVDLYEKNERLGGKISEINSNGFRFDTGPSLFTLPNLVDDLLNKNNMSVGLTYTKIKNTCRYFYADGTQIEAYADVEQFAQELWQKNGENPTQVQRYLKRVSDLYQLTAPVFIFESFHRLKNYGTKKFWRALLQIHKLDSLVTMNFRNTKSFNHPRTIQLFNRYATYNGSNPYKTPATFNVIAHLENNLGAYFPEKGMYSIVQALEQKINQLGGQIYTNTPVEKIELEKDKAVGIHVNNHFREYDAVVTDLDVYFVYKKLLKRNMPSFFNSKSRSTSALIFYWEMAQEFSQLDLHNIFFAENYAQEFEYLFDKKQVYPDPTVYVFISNKITKTDAPAGKENWFVMINVPENQGQDWNKIRTNARKNILQKLNKQLYTNIEQYIEKEHVADPMTIENQTASYRGALYGNSSNHLFSAFMRHPNFRNKIKNLYFVGGSVHPGGGIPLSIASANIVTDIIKERMPQNRYVTVLNSKKIER